MMTPEEIKDLEARAEEYAKRKWAGRVVRHKTNYARDFAAGARAQDPITRKATIDEVLGLLRNEHKSKGAPYVEANWDSVAAWLEKRVRGDITPKEGA